jgi:tRNA U34 5-methylaminomethyl-2-thiouridine-forming methyltransferase MnmC
MKRKIFITDDGSTSIHLPEIDEQYHSKHGAIQEAYHVFIKSGLDLFKDNSEINILEIGFGTGLNCFITFLESLKRNLKINYIGVEAYPITNDEVNQLNYVKELNVENQQAIFSKLHHSSWEEEVLINDYFKLTKQQKDFKNITDKEKYNLIYFDAFGARVQPELWTEEIFRLMYEALQMDGVLVTYAAKGSVRRAMQSVGFTVERLEGPKGKREMLRAIKSK